MALRKRKDKGADDDNVDLAGPEHAWWAGGDPQPADEPAAEAAPVVTAVEEPDPYTVLKVPPSATWEQITSAYHRLARMWHPDGLQDPAPGERELCEDMIRRLNVAYTELRVRRGK